jgi:hypothetical protein
LSKEENKDEIYKDVVQLKCCAKLLQIYILGSKLELPKVPLLSNPGDFPKELLGFVMKMDLDRGKTFKIEYTIVYPGRPGDGAGKDEHQITINSLQDVKKIEQLLRTQNMLEYKFNEINTTGGRKRNVGAPSWKPTARTHKCKDGVTRKVYVNSKGAQSVKCKVGDSYVYKKV